jgi:hypothetical protein
MTNTARIYKFSKSEPIGLLLLLSRQPRGLSKEGSSALALSSVTLHNEPVQRNYARRPPIALFVRSYQRVVPWDQVQL